MTNRYCSSVSAISAARPPPKACCVPSRRANFPDFRCTSIRPARLTTTWASRPTGAPLPRRGGAATSSPACVRGRSRVQDFAGFDYVLAMDRANLAELEPIAPPDVRAHVGLFLEFAPEAASTRCRIRTTAASKTSSACSTCASPGRADCCAGSAARMKQGPRACAGARAPLTAVLTTRRGAGPAGCSAATTTRPRRAWLAAAAADRAVPACLRCVRFARRFGTFRARGSARSARRRRLTRLSSCGRGAYSSASIAVA